MAPTGAMSGFGGGPADSAPVGDPGVTTGGQGQLVGFLVSFQDDPLGRYWPLYKGKNIIGRAETGQQVEVPIGHGTTSTHHAAVESDGQRMSVSDMGSTNGTFHNEEAIGFQGKRDLRDGDKLRFGGFSVIVIDVASRV